LAWIAGYMPGQYNHELSPISVLTRLDAGLGFNGTFNTNSVILCL